MEDKTFSDSFGSHPECSRQQGGGECPAARHIRMPASESLVGARAGFTQSDSRAGDGAGCADSG